MTKNRAHPFSLPPKLLLFFDLFLALSPTQIDAHRTHFRSHLSLLSCPAPVCIRSYRDCSQEGSQPLAFLLSLLLSPWLKSYCIRFWFVHLQQFLSGSLASSSSLLPHLSLRWRNRMSVPFIPGIPFPCLCSLIFCSPYEVTPT